MMTTEKFLSDLRDEVFTETEISQLTMTTKFKELDEWSSLTALSLVAFFDMVLEQKISGDQIKTSVTIEDLYSLLAD
jgi:acyl carrier protein